MNKIIKDLKKYEASSMHDNQLPVIWKKADNCTVTDIKGKEYIDFTSGIFVANCGHSNPHICHAISTQLVEELTYTYSFPTEIRAKASKTLSEFVEFENKVFFLSSGSEACDAAIKMMRNYSAEKGKGRNILSFEGAMHGKTMLGEKLRGQNDHNDWAFGSEGDDIYHLKFGATDFSSEICQILNNCGIGSIAGFMIESYRGWDASFHNKAFIQELVAFANAYGIPVCFDEIQAGFGRTGCDFGYQHYGIVPDMIIVGKALGNGFPVSAIIAKPSIMDMSDDLTSTYSGNPLACAAVIASIEYYKKYNLVKNVMNLSYDLITKLAEINNDKIKRTTSRGLVSAIVFDCESTASAVALECAKKGLLVVRTGRESIKLGPPLTIGRTQLLQGIEILKKAICRICK